MRRRRPTAADLRFEVVFRARTRLFGGAWTEPTIMPESVGRRFHRTRFGARWHAFRLNRALRASAMPMTAEARNTPPDVIRRALDPTVPCGCTAAILGLATDCGGTGRILPTEVTVPASLLTHEPDPRGVLADDLRRAAREARP